jgi:hypothetical protein
MKVMLDECMSPRASRVIVDALKIHKPPVEAHLLEDYLNAKGALDSDWAERLGNEGGWCVITSDYRIPRGQAARSKGPPLHLILPARKITGFFLGGKIASSSGFEKARSVIYTWPEIWQNALSAAPGTRFRITRNGLGYKLGPWPTTAHLPPSS